MKNVLLKAFSFSVMAIGLNACYYDVEENLYPDDFVACDTTSVTYSATVSPLIDQYCMPCHSSAFANGGVSLEGHTDAAVYALNGKLVGTITHASGFSPMPKNSLPLQACEISKIRIWVDNGAPNN